MAQHRKVISIHPDIRFSKKAIRVSRHTKKYSCFSYPEEVVRAVWLKAKFCERVACVGGCRETPKEMV